MLAERVKAMTCCASRTSLLHLQQPTLHVCQPAVHAGMRLADLGVVVVVVAVAVVVVVVVVVAGRGCG